MSAPLPPEVERPMALSRERVRNRVVASVGATGASPDLVEHVAGLDLYLTMPHLLTHWVPDGSAREDLSANLGAHIVSMTLLDNLVDDDGGLDRVELACVALALHQDSVRELCRFAVDGRRITEVLADEFTVVCAERIRTRRNPAGSLDQWRASAGTYGSAFLGCYGVLAAICGRVPRAAAAARQFGQALGMIITVADDLADYHGKGERVGNLAHLVRTGVVEARLVRSLVEEERARAVAAAVIRPTSGDLVPVINHYADEVVYRLLPAHGG